MNDQRKLNRVSFKSSADVTIDDVTIKGTIDNLSMKGMLFVSKDEKINQFVQGATVSIKIYLSGTTSELTINIMGDIIRKEKDTIAITFKEMELDSFVHLRNVVFYADYELQDYYEFM